MLKRKGSKPLPEMGCYNLQHLDRTNMTMTPALPTVTTYMHTIKMTTWFSTDQHCNT